MLVMASWPQAAAGRGRTTRARGVRYAGGAVAPLSWGAETTTLRVVTFNIQFARHIDSAMALLATAEPLAGADIITLQEMDAPGTSRIAAALGMSYVYYPPHCGRSRGGISGMQSSPAGRSRRTGRSSSRTSDAARTLRTRDGRDHRGRGCSGPDL
jgi:hypothetical protein